MLQLGRDIEAVLVIGRANIAVIAERVSVDIFERWLPPKIGQMEGRIEIDRRPRQIGVARLDIQFGGITQLGHEPAIERPDLLIINHFAVLRKRLR